MPNVVEIGGIHIEQSREPLPYDLKGMCLKSMSTFITWILSSQRVARWRQRRRSVHFLGLNHQLPRDVIKQKTGNCRCLQTFSANYIPLEMGKWHCDGDRYFFQIGLFVEKEIQAFFILAKNVHVRSWMPQVDILCHPNVKAFMAHGGLLGTTEGVFCKVPMIITPICMNWKPSTMEH